MNKSKNRWEMSEIERNKEDTKTMLIAFFVIIPLIFVGFFMTLFLAEFIWTRINTQSLIDLGKGLILLLTGIIIF